MLTDDRLDHLCVGALHGELAPGALEGGAPGLLVSEIIDDHSRFQLQGCRAATAALHAALRCFALVPSSLPAQKINVY